MSSRPTSSRKIHLIAPQPFFTRRGTPFNVRALACQLVNLGYDVHLSVYPFGEDVVLPGVTIHRCLRMPGLSVVPIGFSWTKLICDFFLLLHAMRLSLIHDFALYHGVEEGGAIAGFLGLVNRRPYIVDRDSCMPDQLRDSDAKRFPWLLKIFESIEVFFLRRASAVVTVCKSLTEHSMRFAPGVPVFQIEDFPLEEGCAVKPELVDALRAEFCRGSRPLILYTGNLEKYQGIDLLLEAFAGLTDRSQGQDEPDSVPLLLIVGGEGESLERYRAAAAKLGLSRDVSFAGARPLEQMGAFMFLADVLASPRMVGGNTPLKLYTYMAAERAIVATKIAAHTDVLDESSAYLADLDAKSLEQALRAALSEDDRAVEERKRRIWSAKEIVERQYSKSAFDRRVTELYSFLSRGELSALTPPAEFTLRAAESKLK